MNSPSDNELRGAAERNESRGHRSALLVVIGLVVETVLAAFPSSCPTIEHWAPVAADALIALGVAGEILFSGKAAKAQKELLSRSEKRVADAQDRLGIAEKDAAKLNARAAEAEWEVERLRNAAVSRSINEEIFVEALKGKPTAFVQILYLEWVPDARRLATDLLFALKAAGWPSGPPTKVPEPSDSILAALIPRSLVFGGQEEGISVVCSGPLEEKGTPSEALENALSRATTPQQPISRSRKPETDIAVEKVRVVIGAKWSGGIVPFPKVQ